MFIGNKLDDLDSKLTKPVTRTQVSKSASIRRWVRRANLKHLAIFEQYLGHDVATRGALLHGRNWHGNHLVMVNAVDPITDAQLTNFARSRRSGNRRVRLRAPT